MSEVMNEQEPLAASTPETEVTETYEGTPEELTNFPASSGGPARFDRKKVMTTLCVALAVIVMMGLVFSTARSNRKKREEEAAGGQTARPPREFLQRELDRAEREALTEEGRLGEGTEETAAERTADGLPKATPVALNPPPSGRAAEIRDDNRREEAPPPPPPGGGGGGPPPTTFPFSALVPVVEGSLFPASGTPAPGRPGQGSYAAEYPYLAQGSPQNPLASSPAYPQGQSPYAPYQGEDPYQTQNNQRDKQAFYGAPAGGALSGAYLGDDLLWVGTIIPAVLETAINTDLPGNVIARVSENIYDSRTGKRLLVPQGTILVARYNSSVSYAQHRVQIVWDTLIRPDGYQLELEGMNGVDKRGMAGLPAEYRENWFEYLKAAGLITMFSLANSKMAEEAARYGSADMAAGVTAANAEFVGQIGGNIVNRAMNVQPTLTVKNGEKVNVMLNKNIYFPPADDYPVTEKYILK